MSSANPHRQNMCAVARKIWSMVRCNVFLGSQAGRKSIYCFIIVLSIVAECIHKQAGNDSGALGRSICIYANPVSLRGVGLDLLLEPPREQSPMNRVSAI